MLRSSSRPSSRVPNTDLVSVNLQGEISPAPSAQRAPARVAEPRRGRAYRTRSLAAKIAVIPTVLVMLGCYYASISWTVYISMTRSFLLPDLHLRRKRAI